MTAVFAEPRPETTAAHVARGPRMPLAGDSQGKRVHVEDGAVLSRRAAEHARRSRATIERIVDLGLLLARLDGLERDEIASILHVSPTKLTALVRQTESIKGSQGDRVAQVLRVVDELHKVIERRGTARWFRLPIPELGGRTPLDALAHGQHDRVEALVRSYFDPSYA